MSVSRLGGSLLGACPGLANAGDAGRRTADALVVASDARLAQVGESDAIRIVAGVVQQLRVTRGSAGLRRILGPCARSGGQHNHANREHPTGHLRLRNPLAAIELQWMIAIAAVPFGTSGTGSSVRVTRD